MFNDLKKILLRVKADYADIRYEKRNDTSIGYSGKELTSVTSAETDGFVIRILSDGGIASVAFTSYQDAPRAIEMAMSSAKIMGRSLQKPLSLAPVPQIKDTYLPPVLEDPQNVSIQNKIALLQEYARISLQQPKIVNASINYQEVIRSKWFLSSEGSEINEKLVTVLMQGGISSKEGDLIQSVRLAAGGSDGFQNIRGLHEYIQKKSQLAASLLQAEPVSAGRYNCILDPQLAAVFTHEAFGHFSEADIVETLPLLRQKLHIGAQLGSSILNIVDDATRQGLLGHYKYDDEGVAVKPVNLMTNGVLSGRLHSRRTAAEFDEPVTGHNIAEDFRYAPIVRMGNIHITAGQHDFESLLQELNDGLYLVEARGGQTAGENFTFGAGYGYIIKNGSIQKMIRDINVSGDLFSSLKNVKAVGDKVVFGKTGGCGKGQTNIRSGMGAPHIMINDLMIGGK